MRVLKFGGTSVGSAECIRRVAEIVLHSAASEQVAVVVSAMAGVTDALGAATDHVARRGLDPRTLVRELAIRHLTALATLSANGQRRHAEAHVRAGLESLASLLAAVRSAGECSPAARDGILATGERLAAPLVAAKLRARGLDSLVIDGRELIVTDAAFGEARVDRTSTARRTVAALAALPQTTVPVITGFIGGDRSGRTTTLGRGGSDYTASLVGAAVRASAIEIWTDVDGVLTAPPRLVADAVTIPRLSYAEAALLATLGAKVLHPKTMAPAARCGVPIVVRNSFRPDAAGTIITVAPADTVGDAKAVAAFDGPAPLEWAPVGSARPLPARGLGTVAMVGEGVGAHPLAADRFSAMLRGGGHRVFALAVEPRRLAVAALVPTVELAAAAICLHAALGLGVTRREGPGAGHLPVTGFDEHTSSARKATP